MKDQSQTALILPSAAENLLKALDRRTSVSMILDVEVGQVPFHLIADGDSAVISFYSLSDAIALLKSYKTIASKNNEQVIFFNRVLCKIGLTVCYQNRHFGFIGPKANLLLATLFNFATSFRNKGKASLL